MRRTAAAASCAFLCTMVRPVAAQEAIDPAHLSQELQRVAAAAEVRTRALHGEVARTSELLTILADAAGRVDSFQRGFTLDQARHRAEEAARVVEADPPLPRQANDVYRSFLRALAEARGDEPADRVRARLFATLQPLEEQLIQSISAAQSEAGSLAMQATAFARAETTARSDAAQALRILIAVRKAALK